MPLVFPLRFPFKGPLVLTFQAFSLKVQVRGSEVFMYAIIESGGKQHKVSPGDKLKVERLDREVGEELEFPTLLVVDGEKVFTDRESFRVTGRILGEGRRRKILVFHKKRRKQYKKIFGHRQPFTQVEILSIARA